MTSTLVCDDVLHWAATYTGEPFHAMICDSPYELSFMNSRWDASGISFRPETWAALARHLLPGAFVMAFASSRRYHRLACAMEDAGLILHPSIFNYRSGEPIEVPSLMGWSQSAGFPKARRIDTAVDKEAGVARAVLGRRVRLGDKTDYSTTRRDSGWKERGGLNDTGNVSAPATRLAKTWAGHRYGLQCTKPALEPIIVAQVPCQGRPVDSITTHGAGALNIDGARIGVGAKQWSNPRGGICVPEAAAEAELVDNPQGRWPANFSLQHLPTCQLLGVQRVRGSHDTTGVWNHGYQHGFCRGTSPYDTQPGYTAPDGTEIVQVYQCAPGCPVRAFDAQAGERKAGGRHDNRGRQHGYLNTRTSTRNGIQESYADDGPASRFFHVSDWSLDVAEQLAQADPVRYCAKASAAERHAGTGGRNAHPCIKPLALVRWLATLLLPPAAYAPRRLLVPFCGTSSEMIGGMLAGFEMVLGIEHDVTYVEIGRKRIVWWTGYTVPAPVVSERAPQAAPVVTPAVGHTQLSLF